LAGGNGGVDHGDGALRVCARSKQSECQAKAMQEQNLLLVPLVFFGNLFLSIFFGLFYE
jgi:hypothetical protein